MMPRWQRKNFEAGTALQDYNQAQAQDVTPLAAYTSNWTKSVLRATVNTPILEKQDKSSFSTMVTRLAIREKLQFDNSTSIILLLSPPYQYY